MTASNLVHANSICKILSCSLRLAMLQGVFRRRCRMTCRCSYWG